MDMGCFRIFHDARNDQVMMSIEISFIYTFCFPVNVGCIRVCLGVIILFIYFSESRKTDHGTRDDQSLE